MSKKTRLERGISLVKCVNVKKKECAFTPKSTFRMRNKVTKETV